MLNNLQNFYIWRPNKGFRFSRGIYNLLHLLHGQNLLTCYTSYVITDFFLNNIDFFLNNMVYNEKFVNLLCNICYNRLDNVLHYMLYNMLNRMSLKDIQECLLKKKQNVSLKDTISFEDTIFFKDIRWFP